MKNNHYRLLAIDIDGTLVDRKGVISSADREALFKARDAGIRIALSTGRAAGACLRVLNELQLDGFHVFFDGALVCNHSQDKEVYSSPISPAVLKQAVDFSRSNKVPLELYSSTRYFVEEESWRTDIHTEFFGLGPSLGSFNDIWDRERIIKGGIVVSTQGEADAVGKFSEEFRGRLNFAIARTPAFPGLEFINLLAPGVSKGRALEALVAHLGIDMTEVMAVGDGVNDVSVLSVAGMAVAMQNAPEEVKALADYVTADVDHSGLAAAIQKILLDE